MTTKYRSKGDKVTFANSTGSTITSDSVVVIGHLLGVVIADIADGESGAVAIEGDFELPKVSGAVFSQGDALLFDVSAGAFDDDAATPAAGDVAGAAVAMEDGANGETTARVRLTPNAASTVT